jgi:hypothetical protein
VPTYWVYENWTHKRARMHVAGCSFCNNGRSTQPEGSGRNGQWLGPFQQREDALKALEKTRQPDSAICGFCASEPDATSSTVYSTTPWPIAVITASPRTAIGRKSVPSNTERGKAFQILCGDALRRSLSRDIDLEVRLPIGGNQYHTFDLATKGRDVIAECKAFGFTSTGNNPSAKITTLREAAMYLRAIQGDVKRLLIVKCAPHPTRGETLGRYFVRLNPSFLERVTVREMPETGGDLVCIHGSVRQVTTGEP